MYSKTDANEEEDFPRGGDEVLSALEQRTIKKQAQRDVLFGEVQA